MCDTPIRLQQERGTIYESGGRQLIHRWADVPCGKCLPCLRLKRNDWIFRLSEQLKEMPTAYFVTLTFDQEHLPFTDRGVPTLDWDPITRYWKRLRKNTGRNLVYFCVGEYGTKTHRPHFHAIIYNMTPDEIQDNWHDGLVHIGNVTTASMTYTLKYMDKQGVTMPKEYQGLKVPIIVEELTASHKIEEKLEWQDFWNAKPESRRMSKGIGDAFMTPNTIKKVRSLELTEVALPNGAMIPLPRYYRKKMFLEEQPDGKILDMSNRWNLVVQKRRQDSMKLYKHQKAPGNNPDIAEETARRTRAKKLTSEANKLREYN